MKYLLLLLIFVPLPGSANPGLASTVIRIAEQPGVTPAGEIVSIDGVESPDEPTSVIFMSGKRIVAYRCPGVSPTTPPASLQMDLKGGMVYELVCNGSEAKVRVSKQVWP